jgi:hypothetical protein
MKRLLFFLLAITPFFSFAQGDYFYPSAKTLNKNIPHQKNF